ncbi:MAG: GAF domain-containing protein [Chloroflexota bacterium]
MLKNLRFLNNLPQRIRVAFGIIALMAVALSVGMSVFASLAPDAPAFAVHTRVILTTGMIVLVSQLTSLWLLWKGRTTAAHWLAFLPLFVMLLVAPTLVAGIELAVLAVAIIPVLVVNSLQSLPTGQARTLTIIGITVAILILLIDRFSPVARMEVPEISTFSYFLISGEILVFGFILLRQFPSYPLRTKQLVALLSVSLMVMLVFGILTYFTTETRLTTDAGRLLHNGAVSQSRILGDFVSKQMDLLTALKNRKWPAITSANTSYSGGASTIQAEIAELDEQWVKADQANNNQDTLVVSRLNNDTATVLNEYKASFPENAEVFITDKYGALVAATNRTSDYYQADEEWWQIAYNDGAGDVYIGQIVYDESIKEYAIIIAIPLFSAESEKVIGVLRTTVSIQAAIELLDASLTNIEATHTDILFPGGQLFAEDGMTDVSPEFQTQMQNLVTGGDFAELDYEGAPSLLSVSTIQSYNPEINKMGWIIIVHQPSQVALAPLNAQLRTIIIAGLLLAGLSALIAFFLSRSLTRPILGLTDVAKKIAGGNLAIQAKVETSDEVGQLAATFNSMTSQLRELIGTLEQRVADRTKALANVAEISTIASNIQNEDEMLATVVHLVQRRFDLYHAHVFTYNEENGELQIVACGYKEGDEHEGTHETATIPLDQEQSLVARAGRTKKPVIVNDVRSDPSWLPNPLLPDTAAELAVPLLAGDRLIGILDVQSDRVGAFTESDADIQMTLSAQIAVASQNIRQFKNSQKIANDLSVVANVGIATSTIAEIGHLLQEVVDLSKKSFNLYHAHIYLLNEAGDTLDLTAGAGEVGRKMVREERHIPLNSEKSLVARSARTREGVVVNDVSANPDFLPHPLLPHTRAEMAVPMIVAGNVIGVLDVQSETANHFTSIDVDITTTLASQIAVALQNARSFVETRRRAERETLLNAISQKIQSTTTIESALQTAARELGHVLGMKPTVVALESSFQAAEDQRNDK